MKLLIPLDIKDRQKGKICYIKDLSTWACVTVIDGKMQDCNFIDDWQDSDIVFDCVVLLDESENIWSFIERSIFVLKSSGQSYIDEIVDAFIFKTLHAIEY